MATGSIDLAPMSWKAGDGSTDNVAAGQSLAQGTQTGIKLHEITLDFDGAGSTIESRHNSFQVPANYASGGELRIGWIANATANAVKWQAKVAATTAGDADTPLEHAYATAATVTTNVNTTEANRRTLSVIDLSAVMDGAVAYDYFAIVLFRDPSDGSDTAAVDARVIDCAFHYTVTT